MSADDPSLPGITDMQLELPAGAAREFDAPAMAKELLRTTRAGAFATNDPASGYPLATLVNVATDADGAPLLLLSSLSLHTRNLGADGRCSLLLASQGRGDPLAHPRLTLVGTCALTDEPRARRRFLSKHPKSKLYVDLPGFTFWRMVISNVHLNGGFARAAALTPGDVLTDVSDAASLVEAEEGALAHMNEDHTDAIRLYATKLGGGKDGAWTITGCDPDGLDLSFGDETCRVSFPHRVTDAAALRKMLVELAERARNAAR